MSNNSRWPDVKLPSSFRSLWGSSSNEQEKADLEGAEAIAQLRAVGDPLQLLRLEEPSGARVDSGDFDDAQQQVTGESYLPGMMADEDGTYDDYEQIDHDVRDVGDADEDFGDLEMFDSNAAQGHFSSAPVEEAPEAAVQEAEPPQNKKAKSKKKKNASSQLEAEGEKKSSRRTARAHPEQVVEEAEEAGEPEEIKEDEAELAIKSLKKRKLAGSAHDMARKKQKAEDDDEEQVPASPSEARLQRRNHSREASAAPEAQMDIAQDGGPPNITPQNVQELALEAMSGLNDRENASEYAAPPEVRQNVYEDVETLIKEPPSSTPRKLRSTRGKKAKPTFYEAPPPDLSQHDIADPDGYQDDLPSPSAMSPQPRKRGKQSSRTSKKGKGKLWQSMRGGSNEDGNYRAQSQLKKEGYVQGRFTDEELARIATVIEHFRAQHHLQQHEVNEMIQAPGGTNAGETHAELWEDIFQVCQHRHRQKIINVARKKWHNFVARGTWTPEQDAELTELINEHGQKWSKIGALINRHPEDLRDRHRNYLICGTNQRKDIWNEEEESQLTELIMASMNSIDDMRKQDVNNDKPILRRSYEEIIDWQTISENMGRTRSRLQCITKWKSLNIHRMHENDQLASIQPDAQMSFRLEKARRQIAQMPDEERSRLVMAVGATSATTEAKVPWQRLVDKDFRNSWHRTTQVLLWRRLRSLVPDQETKTTQECAAHLLEVRNQTGGLPNLDDAQFDLQDENAFMTSLPASGTPGGGARTGARRKSDKPSHTESIEGYIAGPSGELAHDGHAQDQGKAVSTAAAALSAVNDYSDMGAHELGAASEMVLSDLQIDPALAAVTADSMLPEMPPPSQKKKKVPRKSRKKPKNSEPFVTEDMMHDVDPALTAPPESVVPSGVQDDSIGLEDFNSNTANNGFQHPLAAAVMEQQAQSPSEMDDMEDLPAQVVETA